MKILWVCPTLLHPTTNGSQIRTLGILRHLSRKHEIHFVGLGRRDQNTEQYAEYCSEIYSFLHEPPRRASVAFAFDAFLNLFSPIPLNVARYASRPARQCVERLLAANAYDAVVVDFLLSAPNVPSLDRVVLFQHNVEGRIMERLASEAASLPLRFYFRYLSQRLKRYEQAVCRRVKHVIAVSPTDSAYIAEQYGVKHTTPIPTGVNLQHFERRREVASVPYHDLVFVGSLDYFPNIEGVQWFMDRVLPLILAGRPEIKVALVGKNPVASIHALAAKYSFVCVTGTVPDVRPYLWNAGISIVPLYAGSGTRLKIYEAMAAGLAVVSTRIGAEGLYCTHDADIVLADTPEAFAAACLSLCRDETRRTRIAQAGQKLVRSRFDWSDVAVQFETILERVGRSG